MPANARLLYPMALSAMLLLAVSNCDVSWPSSSAQGLSTNCTESLRKTVPEHFQGKTDPKGKDPTIALEAKPVVLPEICSGSWGTAAPNLLGTAFASLEIPSLGLIIAYEKGAVEVWGYVAETPATHKLRDFKPKKFEVPKDMAKEEPPKRTLKPDALKTGIDLEVSGQDGNGALVVRIESAWNGIAVEVISGWEIQLEREKLYVVDSSSYGKLASPDYMVYGDRRIWMPWHTVTCSGDTIYYDLKTTPEGKLTAKTRKMASRGADEDVWNLWQDERKNQGVPPGIFSLDLQKACEKHAEYCRQNSYKGNDELPEKPGFSKEGRSAASSSVLHFLGRKKGAEGFRSLVAGLFSRARLLDPRDVVLQLGGNEFAFLIGSQADSTLPTETRKVEVQLFPAPGSKVANGVYAEEPVRLPILDDCKQPGLPIFLRLPNAELELDEVEGTLYAVDGDLRTGERRGAILTQTIYSGFNAPKDLSNMKGIIAVVPGRKLLPGVYQIEIKHKKKTQRQGVCWDFDESWRFTVENR